MLLSGTKLDYIIQASILIRRDPERMADSTTEGSALTTAKWGRPGAVAAAKVIRLGA